MYSGKDGVDLYVLGGGLSNSSNSPNFGWSVGGAGDVNGDSYADVIVGGFTDSSYANDAGSARVYSGKDGLELFVINGSYNDANLGWSVSGVGDVNGDGFSDFVAGAPNDYNNGAQSGSARVLSGVSSSMVASSHLISLNDGGSSQWTLCMPDYPYANYVIVGSLTGTSPGFQIGTVTMPLNADAWTDLSFVLRNGSVLTNTFSTLDVFGMATASFNHAGGIVDPVLEGLTFFHAALIFSADGCGPGCAVYHKATNFVPLTTVP